MTAPSHPPGWVHLHSRVPSGPGWVRAKNDPPIPGEPPHGAPLPHWDRGHAPFDPSRLNPNTKALWQNPGAPYGHAPHGAPYTLPEYAERFHKLGPNGEHWVAFPPNDGALWDTKVDYGSAKQYVSDFGARIDRIGQPSGNFMAYMGRTENGTSAPYSYEARAIHYDKLYEDISTYTLSKLPPDWTIRVMHTAPALGQPGGSVSLIFLDDLGDERSVTDLITAQVLR